MVQHLAEATVALTELVLGAFPIRDVRPDADDFHCFPRCVAHRAPVVFHPSIFAVLVADAIFGAARTKRQSRNDARRCALLIVGMQLPEPPLAAESLRDRKAKKSRDVL